jgi:hypothetical protein
VVDIAYWRPRLALQVTFTVAPGAFVVAPATGINVTKQSLDAQFQPILTQLTNNGLPYQYLSQQFPSFLESYRAMNLPSANVSNAILGGRLLPRLVVKDKIG